MTRIKRLFLVVSVIATFTGCTDSKDYETAYCALMDISGTYASEKKNMTKIIKAGILPQMIPGDSLFVIMIDSNSYQKNNEVTRLTLDYRPTEANSQKLALSKKLDKFAKGSDRSRHTDISGAMMLCSDALKDTKSGTQVMFIFSDMKEELPAGVVRKFEKTEFSGIDIAAMNVIKLNKDSLNPEIYRSRLKKWAKKATSGGAKSWNTLMDPTKIPEFIDQAK